MRFSKTLSAITTLILTLSSTSVLADYNSDVTRLLKESGWKDGRTEAQTGDAATASAGAGVLSGAMALLGSNPAQGIRAAFVYLGLVGTGLSAVGGVTYLAGKFVHGGNGANALEKFKKTLTYQTLKQDYDGDTADNIALDIYSGYDLTPLLAKYGPDDRTRAHLAQILTQDGNVPGGAAPASAVVEKRPGSSGATSPIAPGNVPAPAAR